MPVRTKHESMIKDAFMKLEDVFTADSIKNEKGKKFASVGQRVFKGETRTFTYTACSGQNRTYIQKNPQLSCLCIGETLKEKDKNKVDYSSTKIRYRELPSGNIKYLSKETMVFIFPDDIIEMLLLLDYIKAIES